MIWLDFLPVYLLRLKKKERIRLRVARPAPSAPRFTRLLGLVLSHLPIGLAERSFIVVVRWNSHPHGIDRPWGHMRGALDPPHHSECDIWLSFLLLFFLLLVLLFKQLQSIVSPTMLLCWPQTMTGGSYPPFLPQLSRPLLRWRCVSLANPT